MTHVVCSGCVEKGLESPCMVPAGTVCVDCWLPTPQQRQHELEQLRHALERSQRTQRDRFAEAALAAGDCSPGEAWDYADAMLSLRDKSYRERHSTAAHTCASNPSSCFQCGKPLSQKDEP